METKVIKRFVEKMKQERYLNFVSTEENRNRFVYQLADFSDLKQDLFEGKTMQKWFIYDGEAPKDRWISKLVNQFKKR